MYVYTVTNKSTLDGIFTHGWSRQFAGDSEGVDYGIGVYGNINYPDNDNSTPYKSVERFKRNPSGNCIIKSRLIGGLKGFLIFDELFAKKVYGENHSIKDQIYAILPRNAADSLWKEMQWYMTLDRSAEGNSNHMKGRTSGLLQYMMSSRFHGNVANPKKYEKLFAEYNIRGALYTGRGDGMCLVVYNYDEITPIAFSTDYGRTYTPRTAIHRYPDSTRKLGHLYRKVDFPIAIQGDDRIYYFAKVQKKNGKWNYIDASTNEEISSVDFDSCTSINPNDGMFQIEFNGKFYDACPDGFFDSNEEGHSWDELPTFNDDEFDAFNEEEKRFNNILMESIKKVLDEFKMYANILKENTITNDDVDEIKYYHYDVPNPAYFDSHDIPSIYHVTQSSNVDSIFKFGFDREFLSTYAYGKGVYAAYDVANGKNQLGGYGNAMLQLKLVGGYDRFLFFVSNPNIEKIARKQYGNRTRIIDQLKSFLSERDAETLYRRCGENIASYASFASEYHLRGAVYQWGPTIAVLPYDFSTVVPYAVSLDGGHTFKKKFNNSTWERFLTNVDVEWRYARKYRKVEKAILGYNMNNEVTGYSKVQKKNGKWNYIDIQTGNEELPIDFDSLTSFDTNTGNFQAEYKGRIFDACFDGFYDDNGDGHDWSEIEEYVNGTVDDDFGDF